MARTTQRLEGIIPSEGFLWNSSSGGSHIDVRRGTFLVDGAPVGRLPENITKQEELITHHHVDDSLFQGAGICSQCRGLRAHGGIGERDCEETYEETYE